MNTGTNVANVLKINISKESDIFMKEPYISNINLECNILYHSDCNKEYVFRKTLKEPVHTDKINWDEVIKKCQVLFQNSFQLSNLR